MLNSSRQVATSLRTINVRVKFEQSIVASSNPKHYSLLAFRTFANYGEGKETDN